MPDQLNIKLTIEEIYKELCPECKDKLLSLAAKSVEQDLVKKQLKSRLESSKEVKQ